MLTPRPETGIGDPGTVQAQQAILEQTQNFSFPVLP